MLTEENTTNFRSRFAAIMVDLKENGTNDLEVMWLMGSLANRLITEGRQQDWPSVKSALSREAYDSLLNTFSREGKALMSKGNRKAAFAVQALAYSMIASKMTDELIVSGDELLDDFIARCVAFYNQRADAALTH